MKRLRLVALVLTFIGGAIDLPATTQEPDSQQKNDGQAVENWYRNFGDRLDVKNMGRPIEMHDSVWIEELTMMEVRDLIKEGKTTALILTGGIEENGPYMVTGKHNYVLRAMGESIARELGNALIAPIVTLEPGNPVEQNISPGTIYLSKETFKAVIRDMANSLKNQGFLNILIMGDSGGNQIPMEEVALELSSTWGSNDTTRVYFIPEYYNYEDVRIFEKEVLGIHEEMEGLHDDYYISSIVMNVDLNAVRTDERIRSGKFIINGVKLGPIEKTLTNGRKIIRFRTEATIEAIRKIMENR